MHRLTAVLQAFVPHQGAGQESRLAQDLKPVARAEHQSAASGKFGEFLHHRRASRDGPRAEIITIREASRQDDTVDPGEVAVAVPHELDRLAQDFGDDVVEVVVAPRAREHDHAELHRVSCLLRVSRCSVTTVDASSYRPLRGAARSPTTSIV